VPKGVVSILPAGREVGEYLVTHRGVDKVGFTGSTAAGRRIAAACGERLRRVTLELGGKSAAIVCEDANLDAAIPQIVGAGTMNNGQACVAQTRVLLPRSRYAESALAAAWQAEVGDPSEMTTEIGRWRRSPANACSHIAKGKAGARCVVGAGDPRLTAAGS
jgi:betaine-aldehyde dehydrogenase